MTSGSLVLSAKQASRHNHSGVTPVNYAVASVTSLRSPRAMFLGPGQACRTAPFPLHAARGRQAGQVGLARLVMGSRLDPGSGPRFEDVVQHTAERPETIALRTLSVPLSRVLDHTNGIVDSGRYLSSTARLREPNMQTSLPIRHRRTLSKRLHGSI